MSAMDGPHLTIRFLGGDADNHQIRLRQLGESLIGIERLITVGLFAVETGRFPKRGERLPFMVQASEPKRGSVEVMTWLADNAVLLPLFHELYLTGATDIIWNWVSGALLRLGGRTQDADNHFDKMTDIINVMDERRHLENMEWIKLANPARQVVAAIGRSCEHMHLINKRDEKTDIDTPMADVIRSGTCQRQWDTLRD